MSESESESVNGNENEFSVENQTVVKVASGEYEVDGMYVRKDGDVWRVYDYTRQIEMGDGTGHSTLTKARDWIAENRS